MPRPRKTDEENKRHKITVRFDDAEYAKICSETESAGVTLSKFMREKALRGYVRPPKRAVADAEAVSTLSKIGGLLKKIHTDSGGAYSGKTAALLDEIGGVIRTITSGEENDRETHSESQGA